VVFVAPLAFSVPLYVPSGPNFTRLIFPLLVFAFVGAEENGQPRSVQAGLAQQRPRNGGASAVCIASGFPVTRDQSDVDNTATRSRPLPRTGLLDNVAHEALAKQETHSSVRLMSAERQW
jgi:hypothetical protein